MRCFSPQRLPGPTLALVVLLTSGCLHELEQLEGRPPPQPTGLTTLGLDSAVQIRWDEPKIRVPHNLYFTPEGGEEQVIENVTNPYVHQGLTNGQRYTYQLVAVNRVGESPRTPPVTAMAVVFNWQEPWTMNILQGSNHPVCNEDATGITTDRCLMVTEENNWHTSRWYGGDNLNAGIDEPLTYIKAFQNFIMEAGGITYTMTDDLGLNMTVERLQPSFVERRNLNIPVTDYTELFIRSHEAILTDDTVYTYLEIAPATFVAGDPCLGRKIRYVLLKGGNTPIMPSDSDTVVVELGKIDNFFRRNILPDLTCEPSAYAIGTIKIGIENPQSDDNWGRWDAIGIIGPPLT